MHVPTRVLHKWPRVTFATWYICTGVASACNGASTAFSARSSLCAVHVMQYKEHALARQASTCEPRASIVGRPDTPERPKSSANITVSRCRASEPRPHKIAPGVVRAREVCRKLLCATRPTGLKANATFRSSSLLEVIVKLLSAFSAPLRLPARSTAPPEVPVAAALRPPAAAPASTSAAVASRPQSVS